MSSQRRALSLPTTLPPHYGHAVTGERFWPRPKAQNHILTALREGRSVALFGPRRTGKSSLMRESARLLRAEAQHPVIEVDGQGNEAVATLFHHIVRGLPQSSWERFRARLAILNLPGQMQKLLELWLSGGGTGDAADTEFITRHWATLARAIAAILPNVRPHPILLIDELPYMCQNLYRHRGGSSTEVERLLVMLREWREQGMAMALGGSIGMRQLLRKMAISRVHLSGIVSITMDLLPPEEAIAMFEALAGFRKRTWWNNAMVQTIITNAVVLTPAYIQFAFDFVDRAIEDTGDTSPEAIAAVMREQIRLHFDHEFYEQFDNRLADYALAEQDAARVIFAAILRDDSHRQTFQTIEDAVADSLGEEQSGALDLEDLLKAFVEDGFLVDDPDADCIRFADNLVHAWWTARDHRRGRRRRPRS